MEFTYSGNDHNEKSLTSARYALIPWANTFEPALISAACNVAFAIGGTAMVSKIPFANWGFDRNDTADICRLARVDLKTRHDVLLWIWLFLKRQYPRDSDVDDELWVA